MLSVHDFYPEFSQAYARGNSRWRIDGLPVELTPLCVQPDSESEGDAPKLLRIFADERVTAHIENARHTTVAELAHLAQELHVTPGAAVRFAVRDASQTLLGVMNCAMISEEVKAANPGLIERILGAQVRFSGELAFYHARQTTATAGLVPVRHGERNELAEQNRKRWLRTLRSKTFRSAFGEFSTNIQACMGSIESISTGANDAAGGKAVLCSAFAGGYAVLVRLLSDLARLRGTADEQIKLLLFTDTQNTASLRMLLPFGAKLEGFGWYPNPDGSRRARVILSQTPAGITAFLEYFRAQISGG